jgi:hypothetical protein
MACWRDANAEARKRFLKHINARPATGIAAGLFSTED